VLHALGRADQGCVLSGRIAAPLHELLALRDQAPHGHAVLGRHRDAEFPEGLVDAPQVLARLLVMMLDGLTQLVVMSRLRHLRKRHDELLLRAVQILELRLQDVLERVEPIGFLLFESYFLARGSARLELQTGVRS